MYLNKKNYNLIGCIIKRKKKLFKNTNNFRIEKLLLCTRTVKKSFLLFPRCDLITKFRTSITLIKRTFIIYRWIAERPERTQKRHTRNKI